MKDLLPALDLPTPLVIDFDYELNRSDQSGSSELHASHSSPIESVPMPSISEDPFHPSRYFEIPSITVHDEVVASSFSPTRSSNDSEMSTSPSSLTISLSPPPSKPLDWIWICHLCHSRYPLGATRRCLVDGHYYCSGESSATQRNVKRRKRGTSCSSEFDYVGWKDWGIWRRSLMASQERYLHGHDKHPYKLKGCENCEYPSECRYEKMKQPTDKTATSYFHDANSPTSPPADTDTKQPDEDVEMSDVSDSTTTNLVSTLSVGVTASSKELTLDLVGVCLNSSKTDITMTNKHGIDSLDPHNQASGCSISRGSSAASKPAKKSMQDRDKRLTKEARIHDQNPSSNLSVVHEHELLATTTSTTAITTTPIQIPQLALDHTVKFETRRFYSTLVETDKQATSMPIEAHPPRQKQTNRLDRKSDRPARKNKTNNNNTSSSNFERSTFQLEASKDAQIDTTTKNEHKIKHKINREDKGVRQINTTTVTSSYRDSTYTRSSTSPSNIERSSSSSNSSTQNLIRDFLGFGKST